MSVLIALCVWTVVIVGFPQGTPVNNRFHSCVITVGLALFAVIASAVAYASVYDRTLYTEQYERISVSPFPGLSGDDPLFAIFLWCLAHVAPTTGPALFGSVAGLCAIGHVFALWRLLPPWGVLVAWLTTLASGLFFAYVNVAARQGLAVACLMIAVSLYATGSKRRIPFLALLVAASMLHWSAIPVAVGMASLRVFRPRLKILLLGWGGLAFAFVLHLPSQILGGYGRLLPAINDYGSSGAFNSYRSGGDRLDFLAVSVVILAVALIGVRALPEDQVYRRLVSVYLVFNSFFLLFGSLAFSDRMAAYSWFLGPLLLWFPIVALKAKANRILPVGTAVGVVTLGLGLGPLLRLATCAGRRCG